MCEMASLYAWVWLVNVAIVLTWCSGMLADRMLYLILCPIFAHGKSSKCEYDNMNLNCSVNFSIWSWLLPDNIYVNLTHKANIMSQRILWRKQIDVDVHITRYQSE